MKLARFVNIIVIAGVMASVGFGCKKGPGYLTPLPGRNKAAIQDPGQSGALTGTEGLTGSGVTGSNTGAEGTSGTPMGNPADFDNWKQDSEVFKQDTVYFAFDSSAVDSKEKSKVAAVADYLKEHTSPRTAVRIEGNCDERGTEEYNRALGERRALSVREELISRGIDPSRVITMSYGEDRPAVQGQNEAAYSKNRRAEFILLTEP